MTESLSKNFNWRVFRSGSKNIKMQDNFIFFDTESNEEQIDDLTKNLTFKLGSCIIWNRKEEKENRFMFHDISKFWNEVDKAFDKNHKQYILFAHNVHFDMKMCDGFNQLDVRGWKLINHYVRNRTYIMLFKKNDYILHVWDTNNYFIKSFSVAQIGESLNLPKLKVDFKKDSIEALEIYCMRDTEILYVFIKQLVSFLIEHDLSRLKATASSLSFNTFRRKFYDIKNKQISIHDWKKAILLERASYRGGITDVFRLGKHDNVYKTDINSHYPLPMREMNLPVKLNLYTHESDKILLEEDIIQILNQYDVSNDDKTNQDILEQFYLRYKDLKEIYDKNKDVNVEKLNENKEDREIVSKNLKILFDLHFKYYGVIAKITCFLPKKYAYILYDYGLGKTSFAWGKIKISVCSPELKFIQKYGKILKIHEMNCYEVRNIFREFVEFFYDLKKKYDKEDNKIFRDFSKLMLNGNYGKWGQKEYISEQMDFTHEYLIKHQDLLLDIIEDKKDLINKSAFVYLGSINAKELYVIDKYLYIAYKTDNNSEEAFVAISSFITSQARMNLIKYILIAGRKNVLYCDTDSIFCNEKGYKNLLENDCIDDFELGKLKVEGKGKAQFYNPKFYDFKDDNDLEFHRKCKGIKQKNSRLLEENENMVKYQIEQWDKFKSDMKKGNFTNQLIRLAEKIMSKKYDKGNIMDKGYIEPYHVSQIKNKS